MLPFSGTVHSICRSIKDVRFQACIQQEGTIISSLINCTERNPQQPLLGFVKLELLYTGRNRVSTPARVPE